MKVERGKVLSYFPSIQRTLEKAISPTMYSNNQFHLSRDVVLRKEKSFTKKLFPIHFLKVELNSFPSQLFNSTYEPKECRSKTEFYRTLNSRYM